MQQARDTLTARAQACRGASGAVTPTSMPTSTPSSSATPPSGATPHVHNNAEGDVDADDTATALTATPR
jgi:hypothetical protein